MKKYSKINENDIRRLVKQILTEGISNDVVNRPLRLVSSNNTQKL